MLCINAIALMCDFGTETATERFPDILAWHNICLKTIERQLADMQKNVVRK